MSDPFVIFLVESKKDTGIPKVDKAVKPSTFHGRHNREGSFIRRESCSVGYRSAGARGRRSERRGIMIRSTVVTNIGWVGPSRPGEGSLGRS